MLTATLVTKPRYGNNLSAQQQMNGFFNLAFYTFTREYHSAFKNKEILSFVATQMNLENMILREISQTQKGRYQ